MIMGLFTSLFILAYQNVSPAQTCEIRVRSWCLVSGGYSIKLDMEINRSRTWTLTGGVLNNKKVIITEDLSCGSLFSDTQTKTEEYVSFPSGVRKYIIKAFLRNDARCNIIIEIPLNNRGERDDIAYDLAVTSVRSCIDKDCNGKSVINF